MYVFNMRDSSIKLYTSLINMKIIYSRLFRSLFYILDENIGYFCININRFIYFFCIFHACAIFQGVLLYYLFLIIIISFYLLAVVIFIDFICRTFKRPLNLLVLFFIFNLLNTCSLIMQ